MHSGDFSYNNIVCILTERMIDELHGQQPSLYGSMQANTKENLYSAIGDRKRRKHTAIELAAFIRNFGHVIIDWLRGNANSPYLDNKFAALLTAFQVNGSSAENF